MATVSTVAADKRLPHQIVLTVPSKRTNTGGNILVSCNCRIRRGLPPLGSLPGGGDPWEIYTNGEHDGQLTERVSGERRYYRIS